MIKRYLSICAAILSIGLAKAQDPEMTQYYAAPIYTNPAMAGTGSCDGGGRININYRNQWPSLPGTFVTTLASYDQHFDGIGGGIGIILRLEKIKVSRSNRPNKRFCEPNPRAIISQ